MNTPQVKPWYRQFWPWFLIALPATAVIASIYTIYLAVQNQPIMVESNYYRKGLTINERIEQDQRADKLGIQANLLFSAASQKVNVYLNDKHPATDSLLLLLSAPGDETLDRSYELKTINGNLFSSALSEQPTGRFYITLEPKNKAWRLQGEITLPRTDTLTLSSPASATPVTNE